MFIPVEKEGFLEWDHVKGHGLLWSAAGAAVGGGSVWEVSLSLSSKNLLWCPTTVQLSLLAAKGEAEMQGSQGSQSPRMGWVGRDHKAHLIPPSMLQDLNALRHLECSIPALLALCFIFYLPL